MAKRHNRKADCEACKTPKVLDNNREIVELLNNYLNLFVGGNNDIHAEGIRYALDVEGLPHSRNNIRKIIAYCVSVINTRSKRD